MISPGHGATPFSMQQYLPVDWEFTSQQTLSNRLLTDVSDWLEENTLKLSLFMLSRALDSRKTINLHTGMEKERALTMVFGGTSRQKALEANGPQQKALP